jgi:hypothetical protein
MPTPSVMELLAVMQHEPVTEPAAQVMEWAPAMHQV